MEKTALQELIDFANDGSKSQFTIRDKAIELLAKEKSRFYLPIGTDKKREETQQYSPAPKHQKNTSPTPIPPSHDNKGNRRR